MIDVVTVLDGQDLGVADTVIQKARNLLSVQLGSLEYIPDFGVDLKYFLNNPIVFQNSSFKSYLIQRLSQNSISTIDSLEIVENLYSKVILSVQANETNYGGLLI